MGTVLYVTAEVIRNIAILAQPFVPTAAPKLLDQLGVGPGKRSFDALNGEYALKPGASIATPQPVFPRYIEDDGRAAAAG